MQLFGEPPPAPPPVTPGPGPPCPDQAAVSLGGATAHQLCPDGEPPKCRGVAATLFPDPADPIGTPLFGTPGPDVIVGSTADDLIFGRGGRDLICGVSGDDVLAGNAGPDRIFGGANDDRLLGGDDDQGDDLYGESGNDRHLGGPGRDRMDGGTGADTFIGGPGFDGVSYESLPGPVRVDLQARRGPGQDVLRGVEAVAGTSRDDHLFGDGEGNGLLGGLGADVIHGRGGFDQLHGGKGPDTLVHPSLEGVVYGGPNVDRCLQARHTRTMELRRGPLQPPRP